MTGIAQKSYYTALFPLWPLRKNDIPKKNTKRKQRKYRKDF